MEKKTKVLRLNLVLNKEQIKFIDKIPESICPYFQKGKESLCRPTVIRTILNWAKDKEVDVRDVKTEKELTERFLIVLK